MKITTINVNGVRAAFRKGMGLWLQQHDADVLCLQETRAAEKDVSALFGDSWDTQVYPCRIKGRAGVALAVRADSGWSLSTVEKGLPEELYDASGEPDVDSGRWIEGTLTNTTGTKLRVVSAYLHSGELGTEKQAQKMALLERVSLRLAQFRESATATVVCGDFNIVRTECDIKNWKGNHNRNSGVMDEESAYLDAWMSDELDASGSQPMVDVVRALHPDAVGPYTWWSWRGKAFDNDAGWRIDYQMAQPHLARLARDAIVHKASSYEDRFTDHAPLSVTYEI